MAKDSIDKMFDEILGTQKPPSESAALPSRKLKPAVKLPARPSLYDDAARILSEPTDHVFFLLDLLRAPKYMNKTFDIFGHWSYKLSLWINQNKTTVTMQELQSALDDRIQELGLDKELLDAHSHSVQSIAEFQAFGRLPFEEKMQRFRR